MVHENNNSGPITVVSIPENLTRSYFEKALQHGLRDNKVEIVSINISNGSSGGENYCSDIYRAVIEYRLPSSSSSSKNGKNDVEKISVIVKDMPKKPHSDMLEKMEFFEKEVLMFSDIVPRIEKLLGNCEMIAPKLYYATKEPVQTVVMQDLNALGYKLADRVEGLDEEHTKLLLWKLGQYHAGSMALAKEHPKLMESFKAGFFQEVNVNSDMFESVFLKNISHMITIISNWPDYDTIADKLRKMEKKFQTIAPLKVVPKEGDVRVLNHGDLWVNNFLFKYNEKNCPCDVAFIDFQISYYSGLGLDINYFLNTSVQIDLLKTKRYELIRHYYRSLRATLEDLKYSPIPTWNDVKNEITDKEFFGFCAFEGILPLISMDREKSKSNSFESLSDEKQSNERREIMFSSKRMIETMKYSLNRFDELGILDIN